MSDVVADSPAKEQGPYARYRQRYAKLPPAAQMIGLQLWLPFLFIIAFALCYIAAFHHPNPRHVPVAIVGTGSEVSAFAAQLQSSSDGVLDVRVIGTVARAQAEVRSETVAAAYVPGTTSTDAKVIIASGGQFQLATMAKTTFATVAAAQKTTLDVDDIAPLPTYDSYGTSLFYLTLVWIIAGYMVAMFVGMMGAPLGHRIRLGIIAGVAVFTSLLSTLLAGPIVGAVHGHFFALWLLSWCAIVSVGLVVNGLAYFFGRFVTGVALILFVFLNIPASGGAFPAKFMPPFFEAINPYVAGTGIIDALRHIVYDAGPGLGHGALIILGYAVAGAVLTVVGKLYHDRRVKRGLPVSMMHAAQRAAAAAAAGTSGEEDATLMEEEADADAATVAASVAARP